MDVREYREGVEAGLAQARPLSGPAGPEDFAREVEGFLDRVQDDRLAAAERLWAPRGLAAAGFLGERFAPCRERFLAAMRSVLSRGDAPGELRAAVLGSLAAEGDADAIARLRRGLLNPGEAILTAPAALALLGRGVDPDLPAMARDLFSRSTDDATREAALRALATDPGSEDLLAGVMADRSESRNVRAMGVASLGCLNGRRLARLARAIILDDGEDDDIRATCAGAVAADPGLHGLGGDGEFLGKVAALAAGSGDPGLRAAAARLAARATGG